jgi:ApaG protein
MYEATTSGIRVRVAPKFLEENSTPEEGYYFWAYSIEITNLGAVEVQLRSRHWIITDASGRREEVRGPGVVGKSPVLAPGQSFSYTSGCPLRTASGIMVGSYEMMLEGGEAISVAIPAFSLDSPYAVRNLN